MFPPARAESLNKTWLPAALLAVTLFLLSADLLFVAIGGNKIKYAYFLVVGLWLTEPARMFEAARHALLTAPRWPLLLGAPLAVAVATSVNLKSSILWTLWLGFDLFTVLTVYAFLKAHRFSPAQIQTCATAGLALIAFFGIVQFAAIYVFHEVIFAPQKHFELYRLNGISGWPHFLNIFAFLLLPLVVTQERLPPLTKVILAILLFVLVQSTAKTGWVLFIALGALLAWLDRRMFARNFALFLLPVTVIALLVPVPALDGNPQGISGTEKVQIFAEDLDLSKRTTSGTDRVMINKMGLAVWARHPWFGVGPKAYNTYVFTRFDQELPGVNKLDVSGSINAKNENIWIEMLSENGILFTAGFALLVIRALWVRGFVFRNPLHLGTWLALVLYFALSGQVSQTGLLTMVYAVFGIYFYARELPLVAKSGAFFPRAAALPREARSPLTSNTEPGT